MSDLDQHVSGGIVLLAARVKEALEAKPSNSLVETYYGNFYVSRIELTFTTGGDSYTEAVLVPDEGEGSTYDLYTLKESLPNAVPKELDGDISILPCADGEKGTSEVPDWKPLGEDVTYHAMGPYHQHKDERGCMWHARLRKWAFVVNGNWRECLRYHDHLGEDVNSLSP